LCFFFLVRACFCSKIDAISPSSFGPQKVNFRPDDQCALFRFLMPFFPKRILGGQHHNLPDLLGRSGSSSNLLLGREPLFRSLPSLSAVSVPFPRPQKTVFSLSFFEFLVPLEDPFLSKPSSVSKTPKSSYGSISPGLASWKYLPSLTPVTPPIIIFSPLTLQLVVFLALYKEFLGMVVRPESASLL